MSTVPKYSGLIALAVGMLLLLLPVSARCQATAALAGSVKDQSGAIVPNATVTVTNEATKAVWTSVTTNAGLYTLPNLPPGNYDLAVSASGFRQFVQSGITVTVGSTTTADVVLQVGKTSQSVEVHANAPLLQATSSEVGTTVQANFIAQLPLQVSGQVRDPIQFVELTPGFSGSIPDNPSSQLSYKINGGQEGGTDVLVDGASTSLTHPNLQMQYGVGADAVGEFKVITGSFPAQYGRATGGIVNLVLKSGTNQLHGTAYDYIRNSIFDANGWYNNYRGVQKGPDNQNDYGFNIGGPVWLPKVYDGRNKTFFMFNAELYRFKQGGFSNVTVPDAAWENGDFSNLLTPTTSLGVKYPAHQLYDYTTCNPGPCQPFAGNIIPMNRIDPVVEKEFAYMPKPQNGNVYNNFLSNDVTNTQVNLWSLKVDEYITPKQNISGSWSYDDVPKLATRSLGDIYTTKNPTQYTDYGRLNYNYSFSPTLLNYANFGFSRTDRLEQNLIPTLGKNLAAQVGLKGVTGVQLPSLLPSNGVLGTPDSADSYFIDNGYEIDDNLTWMKGRHSMMFGVDVRRMEFNSNQLAYTSGRFLFGQSQTSNLGDPNFDPNSGFGFASLFLGAAGTAWVPTPEDIGLRTRYYAVFAQDDFKATSKLTLNLGLRYEIPTPITESHDRLSWMNPTLANPGAGGLPGAMVFAGSGPGRTGLSTPESTYYKSIAPRVGLAYLLTPNTVIRAGYGIYYSPMIVSGFAEVDSAGFSNSCQLTSGSSTQPVLIPGQMTGYPCALPPFINPTLTNGSKGGSPLYLLTNTAIPGMIHNWTLDVQRQLGKNLLLDVGYVGSHGYHLDAEDAAPNQVNPKYLSYGGCLNVLITQQATNPACAGKPTVAIPYPNFLTDWGGQATVAQALRPFPQYTDMLLDNDLNANPIGYYDYDGFQVQLQKRFSAGLTFLASYSWQKTLTNSDGAYPPEGGWNNADQAGTQNTYNQAADKALSAQDVPQSFVLAYTYELPVGTGRRFLSSSNRLANAVVGGWTVGAVQTYESGTPISIRCSNSYTSGLLVPSLGGNPPSCRVNVVPGVPEYLSNQGPAGIGVEDFNRAAFAEPANFTLGNASRVSNIRLPAGLDEDISIEKKFNMTERFNAILRLEMFNAFNRHAFGGLDNTVTDPNFGQFTNAGGNRTMQMSLRLSF
ncbi:MAG: carboxypeptidase regulatory-like domain-containing protein [Terriglobia bacterium]